MISAVQIDVICEHCGAVVAGDSMLSTAKAEASALNNARAKGWLQIGDAMWCASCAPRRAELEKIRELRRASWVPKAGMRVRFTRPDAGRDGDMVAAHEWLSFGMVYTIADMRLTGEPVENVVMISFSAAPGNFYNCEQFEPVNPAEEKQS